MRCAFDQARNSTKRELGYSCRSARQEVRDGVRVAMGMSMGMGNGDDDGEGGGEDSSCALQACACDICFRYVVATVAMVVNDVDDRIQ